MSERQCANCGQPYYASMNRRLCRSCRKRVVSNSTYPGISTGTVGAIGELRVSTDLLARGYEVFRAVSPSCSCDLIARKGGRALRIEVRTAHGSPENLKVPSKLKDVGRQDHFAAVLPDQIVYLPKLEETNAPQESC